MASGNRDPEMMSAFGWMLIVVGIVYGVGAWFAAGVYFEPWALIFVAAGVVLTVLARVRAKAK